MTNDNTKRICHQLSAYPILFGVALTLGCLAPVELALSQELRSSVKQDATAKQDDQQSGLPEWADLPKDAVLYQTGFSSDWMEKEWTLLGGSWKHDPASEPPVLSQFRKESDFKPPFRSPFHMGLLNMPVEGSFVLEATVKSTHEDYGHRDVCFFLGVQDTGHFYYVHLGKKADPHANQIFIVNGADRKSISLTTTEGTNWDDNWHRVRIRRNVTSGEIAVWFDDLEKPAMTAKDETFREPGQVGVGSFDDTADFSIFRVYKMADDQGDAGSTTKGSGEEKSGTGRKSGNGGLATGEANLFRREPQPPRIWEANSGGRGSCRDILSSEPASAGPSTSQDLGSYF